MSILTAQQWFATPLGQYVVEHEFQYFDSAVANIFGYHAMQMGMPHYDFLRTNRMPLRFTVGAECNNALRATCDHLPIAGDTIDLVIVPHVLEFNENPHQILREIYRVLIPEGHVVISGFNPFSLWGVHHFHIKPGRISLEWKFYCIAATQRLAKTVQF